MPLPSRPKDGGISFLAHPPRTPASVLWQQSCRSLGRERVWFHPPNASHGPTFYHLVPLTSKPFWLWIVPKYIVKATLIKQLGGIPLKKKNKKHKGIVMTPPEHVLLPKSTWHAPEHKIQTKGIFFAQFSPLQPLCHLVFRGQGWNLPFTKTGQGVSWRQRLLFLTTNKTSPSTRCQSKLAGLL